MASANWLVSPAPTVLKAGGIDVSWGGAGADPDGVGKVGLETDPPSPNALNPLDVAATADAIPSPALIVFKVTHGWPTVSGKAATALAFATPVLTAILAIDAALSAINKAFCTFCFYPLILLKH